MSASVRTRFVALAAAGAIALLGGCSQSEEHHDEHGHHHEHEGHDHGGHGHVEGAEQLKEPALSLVTASVAGEVHLVDLASLESAEIAHLHSASALSGDDRYVAVQTEAGVELVDSGVWTWEHGDHAHYYRAVPGVVAQAKGTGGAVASSNDLTVVRAGDAALVLDKEELQPGTPSTAGLAVPGVKFAALVEDTLITVEGGHLVTRELGDPLPAALPAAQNPVPCADFAGGAASRAGVVVACGNVVHTATLDHQTEEVVFASHTLLDVDAAAPARFCGRANHPHMAALSMDGSALWLVDMREAKVTRVEIKAPLASACALGDDANRIAAVDTTGAVRVFAGADTSALQEAAVSEGVASADSAKLGVGVTANRAYVVGADGKSVVEIDPADSARVARTIPTEKLLGFAVVGQ
ncbi:MAG: hypothetical protein Q3999_03385 [Buchananella hordeovulneris]|nr:hypothetical protein [Buchananella hordeovulneris]